MAKIIRQEFSPQDFNRMAEDFLFSDVRVSLPAKSLASLKEHLVKAGPSFQKVFQAYFEKKDNTRYDDLTRRMESLVKKIHKYNADLEGEERNAFILFWNEVVETIEADYRQLHDQYLTNSCNYFIHEINKLS